MAKSEERLKAIQLRRAGESMKDIAAILAVSKSAVSLWVRDISLTASQQKRLRARMIAGGHNGRMLGAQMNRDKKLRQIEIARMSAKKQIGKITRRDLLLLGLGLYWGEGVKSAHGTLAIVNSDPAVIRTAIEWFMKCFALTRDRFRPRIFINASHRDRERVLLHFWSKTLALPKEQFSKTIFLEKPNKKVYENRDTYYGVLTLRISKGTNLRYQILAAIKELSERDNTLPA